MTVYACRELGRVDKFFILNICTDPKVVRNLLTTNDGVRHVVETRTTYGRYGFTTLRQLHKVQKRIKQSITTHQAEPVTSPASRRSRAVETAAQVF
jgi:hypothetical protein